MGFLFGWVFGVFLGLGRWFCWGFFWFFFSSFPVWSFCSILTIFLGFRTKTKDFHFIEKSVLYCFFSVRSIELVLKLEKSVVCFYKNNHIRCYKIDCYFEQLDPYDYETIEIVLKVIQNADEKNTSIQLNQVRPNMLLLPC